jgi:hypothetical protein
MGVGRGTSVLYHIHSRKHLPMGGDTSGSFHSGRECGARELVEDFSPFLWLILSVAPGMGCRK